MSRPKLLLTGASGGVGASLCRHLRDRFRLLAVVRDPGKLADRVGPLDDLTPLVADLSEPGDVDDLLETLRREHPYVPYLVNNAGVMVEEDVRDLEDDEMRRSLEVNAVSAFRILKALLPAMEERGFGRVINVTSGAPLNCAAGFAAYSASKAALNAVTVTAAREHADDDIRINLMSPGPVRSGMAPDAPMDPSVCYPTVDHLLSLPADGPTGRFFWLGRELPLFPDLEGVEWLEGEADPDRFPEVLP